MKYGKKSMNICKKLGAEKFQKVVFLVEKIKYKVIEKLFPNIDEWYYRKCDIIRDKKLKKCKSNLEKKEIIEEFRLRKLRFKKEIVKKENRNYHIDLNHPEEIKNYLEINKKIHINGLIGNTIFSIILILSSLLITNPIIYVLLIYQFISAIINFQCINLQNYNLCRLEDEKIKRILNKKAEKNKEDFLLKMNKGSKVIGESFRKNIDIPTQDDIIKNITSKEEASQLLEYLKKHLNSIKTKEAKKERKKTL